MCSILIVVDIKEKKLTRFGAVASVSLKEL